MSMDVADGVTKNDEATAPVDVEVDARRSRSGC